MDRTQTMHEIARSLEKSIKEHSTFVDGFWYTAMTVVPLVLSTYSSVAAHYQGLAINVSVASAIAALCIGLERALGFGARWRYHRDMKANYRILLDGVSYLDALPEDRKQPFLNDWWARLVSVRTREGQLPNTGGGTEK